MKGFRDTGRNIENREPVASGRELAVASRRIALETLRRGLGPADSTIALLTGEPGTGKTWLWGQLARDLPSSWRWLSVDMSESLDALEFLRLVSHGLGVAAGERLGTARIEMARALHEESHDGRQWLLIIENAHSTPEPVWTEVRAMVHAMEASGGFAAILLVGPTMLASQLGSRSLGFLTTRMTVHVHLLSLDFDESLELVQANSNPAVATRAALEDLHRDAGGNPRRLLQLLRKASWARPAAALASQPAAPGRNSEPSVQPQLANPAARKAWIAPQPVIDQVRAAEASVSALERPASTLVPSRPPLRVEEGLIEVGWAGSLEAEAASADTPTAPPLATLTPADPAPMLTDAVITAEEPEPEILGEEMIEDHYAALQAWTEWAKNRGRAQTPATAAADEPDDQARDARTSQAEADEARQMAGASTGLRIESEHEHAPYSQIFSRMRQSQ